MDGTLPIIQITNSVPSEDGKKSVKRKNEAIPTSILKMAKSKKAEHVANSPEPRSNDKLLAQNKALRVELEKLRKLVSQLEASRNQPPNAWESRLSPPNLKGTHVENQEKTAPDELTQALRTKNQKHRDKERESRTKLPSPPASTSTSAKAGRVTPAATPVMDSTQEKKVQHPQGHKVKEVEHDKAEKPPPINVLHQDPKDAIELLKSQSSQIKFHIKKISNVKHAIQLHSAADFDEVKELLNGANTSYYSFTPKEKKNFTYLLKGLPQSFSEQEIPNELQQSAIVGHDFVKVIKFKTTKSIKENRALPIFIAQLSPKSDLKRLNELKYVSYHIVSWEKLNKKSDTQCRRCQRFGHSASNCNLNYRCVKCNDPHKPGECKINLEQPDQSGKKPSCVNCKAEGHPASYKGCPKYKEYKLNIRSQIKHNSVKSPREITNPSFIRAGISFASATGRVNQNTPLDTTPNNTTNIGNTFRTHHLQSSILNVQRRTDKLEKTMEIMAGKLVSLNTQLSQITNLLLNIQRSQ